MSTFWCCGKAFPLWFIFLQLDNLPPRQVWGLGMCKETNEPCQQTTPGSLLDVKLKLRRWRYEVNPIYIMHRSQSVLTHLFNIKYHKTGLNARGFDAGECVPLSQGREKREVKWCHWICLVSILSQTEDQEQGWRMCSPDYPFHVCHAEPLGGRMGLFLNSMCTPLFSLLAQSGLQHFLLLHFSLTTQPCEIRLRVCD